MLCRTHNFRGPREMLLEAFITSFHLSRNYTSAKNVPLLKLPVPDLKNTLKKYLISVQPFVNDSEYAKTKALVKDFEKGLGRESQELLKKRAKEKINWLEDWWMTAAYLEYRFPVITHSSPALLFPVAKLDTEDKQLTYVARLMLGSVEYKHLVDNQKIKQEKRGKYFLDMDQHKKIFGTCRIPGDKRDRMSYNSKTHHFVIIHNGHFFYFDPRGEDNKLLSEKQIIDQLKCIKCISRCPNHNAVGIITADHRDKWAIAYQVLSEDETNRKILIEIQDSIVVLCLDAPCGYSCCPSDAHRRTLGAEQVLHGGGSMLNTGNRWFDKPVQFIVGADGLSGLTYEHAPSDGQPIAALTEFMLKYIAKCNKSTEGSSSPKMPRLLQFNITPELACMICNSKINVDKVISKFRMDAFQYQEYGKNFIKKQKLSPDSFIQMAIQFAYYRLHCEPAAQYESASTRVFEGGRTETIRSCSSESLKFAQLMLSPSASTTEKVKALRNAVKAHKKFTLQALQGLGVDRHFLGLQMAAITNGLKVHDFFNDPAFIRSSDWKLSTSQVPLRADAFLSYGPLVSNGYATCYNPHNDDMNFATSSFKHPETDLKAYKDAFVQSLDDMHDILLKNRDPPYLKPVKK